MKKILKSIGLILLIILFPSFFFMLFNINDNNLFNHILYLTISEVIMSGILIYIYRSTIKKDFKDFTSNLTSNLELSFKYWVIGFCIMLFSNIIIVYILGEGISSNEELARSYIDISPILMLFSAVICAPISEELVFRKSIKDAFSNKYLFIIISSLVFGLLHVTSDISSLTDIIQIIPYASFGVVFALLYYKTDNIFSTISMHMMHNLLSILLYLLGASL